MAERKTLHGVAGSGAWQSSKRQAGGVGSPQTQSSRTAVLCDGAESGAEQKYRVGWILSTHERSTRRSGGQRGLSAQARCVVLASDGQRSELCRSWTQTIRGNGVGDQTTRTVPPRKTT